MIRSCVGCRKAGSPAELVRVVVGPDGSVVPDLAGGAFGRGAWLHPRTECIGKAVPRGLAHALRAEVKTDAARLIELLRKAAERRCAALLKAASRASKAALGTTAVQEAEKICLVVVAADARAAAETATVVTAVRSGRAVVFGSKSTLGAIFGREELGVVAILDLGLAEAILAAVRLTELQSPRGGNKSLAMSEVG